MKLKKIVKALRNVKRMCIQRGMSCDGCPFRTANGCMYGGGVESVLPEEWQLEAINTKGPADLLPF